MKKFNKAITKIRNLKNYNKEYDIIAKIISLTYFTTISENILHDKNNKKPEKEIIILINKTVNLFHQLRLLSSFQKDNSMALTKNISILKKHKQLWQDIWPEYESTEFQELINFRNKRFKFNNMQNLYQNKKIVEFGCGNASISMGCILDKAKFAYATDIGKKILSLQEHMQKNWVYIKK